MASKEIEILDSEASVGKLKKIAAGRAVNRRHFIAALGMTGAAAGAGLMSGCSSTSTVAGTTAGLAQTDILNFVLNFKFLEATFYSFITQGTDLSGSAVLNSGAITGAPGKLTFTGTNAQQITDMLNEIYYDEKNHVTSMISLLGSSVVFRPAINLAAFGAITATNALAIARLLEDVGVTAIAGAITGLTTSNATYASQILGTESFHAGAVRLVNLQNPTIAAYINAGPLDVPPFDPGTAALAAAGPTAAGGIFATAGAPTTTATTPQGFAFIRNSSQVLAITYGAPGAPAASGATSGGFFPSGVNGNIKTV
jgi:Ferritin-like domain